MVATASFEHNVQPFAWGLLLPRYCGTTGWQCWCRGGSMPRGVSHLGLRRGGVVSHCPSSRLGAGLCSYFSATVTARSYSRQSREEGRIIATRLANVHCCPGVQQGQPGVHSWRKGVHLDQRYHLETDLDAFRLYLLETLPTGCSQRW